MLSNLSAVSLKQLSSKKKTWLGNYAWFPAAMLFKLNAVFNTQKLIMALETLGLLCLISGVHCLWQAHFLCIYRQGFQYQCNYGNTIHTGQWKYISPKDIKHISCSLLLVLFYHFKLTRSHTWKIMINSAFISVPPLCFRPIGEVSIAYCIWRAIARYSFHSISSKSEYIIDFIKCSA